MSRSTRVHLFHELADLYIQLRRYDIDADSMATCTLVCSTSLSSCYSLGRQAFQFMQTVPSAPSEGSKQSTGTPQTLSPSNDCLRRAQRTTVNADWTPFVNERLVSCFNLWPYLQRDLTVILSDALQSRRCTCVAVCNLQVPKRNNIDF